MQYHVIEIGFEVKKGLHGMLLVQYLGSFCAILIVIQLFLILRMRVAVTLKECT